MLDISDNSTVFADLTLWGQSRVLRYQLDIFHVSVVPISMVGKHASEAFYGCYDNLRVWLDSDKDTMTQLIGYVRIEFNETDDTHSVYYRMRWSDEWQLSVVARKNLHAQLLHVYNVLATLSAMGEELQLPVADPSTGYHLLLDEVPE